MTIDSMFTQLEKYYGAYDNQDLKLMVRAYLEKDHKQDQFKSILKSILYYHPAQYKAPCIASIEECLRKARLEKGITDTHKNKMQTDTSRFNYLEQKKNMSDEEFVSSQELINRLKEKVNVRSK